MEPGLTLNSEEAGLVLGAKEEGNEINGSPSYWWKRWIERQGLSFVWPLCLDGGKTDPG